MGRKPINDFTNTGELMASFRAFRLHVVNRPGEEMVLARLGPTGSRNMAIVALLEQKGIELFYMGRKDTARLMRALLKSGALLKNTNPRAAGLPSGVSTGRSESRITEANVRRGRQRRRR